jgi:hypothetical protein
MINQKKQLESFVANNLTTANNATAANTSESNMTSIASSKPINTF